MSGQDIPCEIILREILWLLPADDLVRYRCVCKVWRDTIDDPSFVETHLNRHHGAAGQLILRDINSKRFYSLSLNSPTCLINHDDPFANSVRTDVFGGSCNGIMLVYDGYRRQNIFLWNPYTMQHRELPPHGLRLSDDKPEYGQAIGLGYDSTSHDFKVVCVDHYHHLLSGCVRPETFIYSLKLDSWKRIKNLPLGTLLLGHGILLNGALHWIRAHDNSILALGLGTEDYYHVLAPPCPPPRGVDSRILGLLNGCMALTCHDSHTGRRDVWLMKDYALDNNSWIKLFSMYQVPILRPLIYYKDKEQVLLQLSVKDLHLLDLKTQSTTKVKICGGPGKFISHTCSESLVRLGS